LLVCLITLVAIQFLGWFGLALLAPGLLLAARQAVAGWWRLLRRMRWLLLSVWLILAYGMPGDALLDLPWMPTHEGVYEASLHVARLAMMLACLAALFAALGKHGLLTALQCLLQPWARLGWASERLVVRLSLVMQNLQEALPKGAWRQMLDGNAGVGDGVETLRVAVPLWRTADSLYCGGALLLAAIGVAFG
jgi:energy-coupling factor transporter transmembrane protein EcfT